ncbi:hypothetical protein U1Q18_016551 [Sarracenia purpurea var. burkii]
MVDSSPSLGLSLSRGGQFSSSASFPLRRRQFHLPEVTGKLKNLQFFAILMSPSSSSPLPESFSNTPAQGKQSGENGEKDRGVEVKELGGGCSNEHSGGFDSGDRWWRKVVGVGERERKRGHGLYHRYDFFYNRGSNGR